MPNVEIKLDLATLDRISRAAQDVALETVGALRGEVIAAQVMPFDNGKLQGSIGGIEQFGDGEDVHTSLCVGDTPYARRLYFHPEYTFQYANNPNAQGLWIESWLPGGEREDYVPETFAERLKDKISG